ncbi:MAG: hypothetical protein ACLF0G_10975 [Candidatus Brocadiia bacterium]
MAADFVAKQAELEARIAAWKPLAGDRLQVDHLTAYSGHRVYALTLSEPAVPLERKRRHYFAQPHAHEPGATAGMVDAIEQLVTGKDLAGRPTALDLEAVFANTLLTFNPIGNPQGREKAPVECWDGSRFSNQQLWCWMRGEDPDKPGQMWHRLDLWDTRDYPRHPEPIGIVYEQIDEHRWVEPNRSHRSTYFQLFFKMDYQHGYQAWLDLHQTEFVRSPHNCMIILPLEGLAPEPILDVDRRWGRRLVEAWKAAGYRPRPEPVHLGYRGQQAAYFRACWGELARRMPVLTTEVKNNAADAPATFQLEAQSLAIVHSIQRLLEEPGRESE